MNKAFLGKLFLHRGQSRWFFLYLTLLLGVALPGTALRLMSVHWNHRLQGDVNLYSLTAREFLRVSRLEYPFKYDYYGGSHYESMRAQAAQHPPLFPLLGGLVSKLTGNSDTFASLKGICFVAGLIALGLVVVLARVTPSASIPVALLLVSFLPIMIDFSGNGSPYIILAAILAGVSILLLRFDPDRPRQHVLLGILLALGYMVHGAITLAVPGVMLFLALNAKRLRFNCLIVLCAAGFLTLAPMMVWNMSYQGAPIYSSQPVLARISLGAATVGIRDGIITTYPASRSLRSLLGGYAHSQWGVVQKQFENLTTALGPGMLLLAAIGLKSLLDEGLISFVAMLGPSASYLALSWLLPWPPQPRFILPVLPVLCVIASVGYKARQRGRPSRNDPRLAPPLIVRGVVDRRFSVFTESDPILRRGYCVHCRLRRHEAVGPEDANNQARGRPGLFPPTRLRAGGRLLPRLVLRVWPTWFGTLRSARG